MNQAGNYITEEKRQALLAELADLKGPKRKEILQTLEYAKSLGDLKENSEYHQAREDQGKLESRIVQIEQILQVSQTVKGGGGDIVEIGSKIIVVKEGSNFKINLIYDERQLLIMQKQKGESGLQAAEDILNTLDMQFNEMKKEYDALISAHKSAAASLEERQKSYKSKVDYWNERGGAPKNEYDALRKEAVVLNKEASVLNNEVSVINAKSRELNTLLDQRNKAAAAYNQTVQIYNQKYGQGLEFDQAEYVSGRKNPLIFGRGIGEEINVYEFTNNADLALALAHEFGHALGMNHVENSKSIMYYTSGANTRASFSPSAEDLAELKRVCELK
jgi:transcription elongation GreA/GreB family factor